ncbi:MAG: T9SS type A sorting domain-containing protein [Bacteroidota bacterium]
MRKSLRLSLLLSLFFFSSQLVYAQLWDGGGDGTSWNDPLNWDGDVEPALGADVDFNTSVTLTLSGSGTAASPSQLLVRGMSTVVNLNFDLDVGNPASTDPAVVINNGGMLNVLAGRTLIVDHSATENAVQLNASASLIVQEEAILMVLQANRGINVGGALSSFANGGTVSLNGCSNHAIFLQPNTGLLNSGLIEITSPGRNGVYNQGGFVNLGGTINITTPAQRGIQNVQAAAPDITTFSNTGSGTILITSPGDDGIRSQATFLNDTDAKITVQDAMDDGIELIGDVFTNNGTININCRAGAIASGPGLAVGTSSVAATFINTSNNSLNINAGGSTSARSIFVYGMGTLQNTGTISSSGGSPTLNVFIQGVFSNAVGGTINMNGVRITNAGDFTNDGLINSTYTGGPGVLTNSFGTSLNRAFYDYQSISNFSNGAGSITNEGTDLSDVAQYTIDFAGTCAAVMQVTAIYEWISGANTVGSNDGSGNITALPGTIDGSLSMSPSVFPGIIFNVINVCAASLPIDLLSFTAEPNDKTVMLKWQTASEINNDFMAVERSIDGRTFQEIGRRNGAIESVAIQNYQLEDIRPQPGANYYRLRQVDTDGTTTYSEIVSVYFKGEQTEVATPKIYPNVVYNGQSIQLDLQSFPVDSPINLLIVDMQGRSWPLRTLDGGSSTQQVLPNLPAGTYILQATNQVNSQTYRFVVVK